MSVLVDVKGGHVEAVVKPRYTRSLRAVLSRNVSEPRKISSGKGRLPKGVNNNIERAKMATSARPQACDAVS
jgi:hypothetical protein